MPIQCLMTSTVYARVDARRRRHQNELFLIYAMALFRPCLQLEMYFIGVLRVLKDHKQSGETNQRE